MKLEGIEEGASIGVSEEGCCLGGGRELKMEEDLG